MWDEAARGYSARSALTTFTRLARRDGIQPAPIAASIRTADIEMNTTGSAGSTLLLPSSLNGSSVVVPTCRTPGSPRILDGNSLLLVTKRNDLLVSVRNQEAATEEWRRPSR